MTEVQKQKNLSHGGTFEMSHSETSFGKHYFIAFLIL